MFATPTVVGEVVYIGSCAGSFYAIDRATGGLRWKYDIAVDGKQTSFHGDPLVVGEQILVGTDYGCAPDGVGHVYAFDAASGRVTWKHRSTGVPTDLVRLGDRVFFGTFRDEWSALDLASGRLEWTFATGAQNGDCEAVKAPAVAGDRLFLASVDGTLYALSAATGGVLWQRTLPAAPTTSLAFHDGALYVGAGDEVLRRLDPATGATLAELSLPATPEGKLTFGGGRLYALLDDEAHRKGYVVAVDDALRRVAWITPAARSWTSERPHLWKDYVVAGNCRGEVAAFAATDGEERWRTAVTGCVRSFGHAPDMLFAGVQEGTVYAFR